MIAAEAVLFRSSELLTELVAVWVGAELFVRFYEEPTLTRTFGEEYASYLRNVRRWMPRLRGWHS